MVYGAVLAGGERYYTDLRRILGGLSGRQRAFNWLLTDWQTNMADEGILNRDGGDFCWLTGDELTELVETNRVQWIWASLSGFPKEISLEEILSEPLPRADRESLWQTPLGIGHPMAEMEIVPFDSSLVILLSRERTVIDDFRRHFPLSEDLTAFMNRQKA